MDQDKAKLEQALRFEKSKVKEQKKTISIEKNEIQRQASTFNHKETMFQSQIRKKDLQM
jgi:hypothetical protein